MISETEWLHVWPEGDYNAEAPISATVDGLEIHDYDTISWEEIDRARRVLLPEQIAPQEATITDGTRNTTGEGWKLWCLEAEGERDRLMRGEFICRKCGLRKDGADTNLAGEF